MHFKNEASPAANPYTPLRRCYRAVTHAAGGPASLPASCAVPCASPEPIPPCRHVPRRDGELMSSNTILPPSCAMVPVAAGLSFPSPACSHGMLLPLAFSPRHGDAATKPPHDAGPRGPKTAEGEKCFTLGEQRGAPWGMALSPLLAWGSAGMMGCLLQRLPARSTASASAREA